MNHRTCPICSMEVVGPEGKLYCSNICARKQRRLNAKSRKPTLSFDCHECSERFIPSTTVAKYCSQKCRSRVGHRQKMASGYYQRPEVKKRQADYGRAKYRKDIADGKIAGARLAAWSDAGLSGAVGVMSLEACCVDGCDNPPFSLARCRSHYSRMKHEQGVDWATAFFDVGADYKARAKRWGVEYEPFSKAKIFDRDGWVCGICSEPINRDLLHPDPLSVSLDHIIPMSKLGGHVPSNVTCAHLFCNLSKGNRHDESGALVGAA